MESTARRVIAGVEQEKLLWNEQRTARAKERAATVAAELPEMYDGISVLMDKNLIPSASTGEPKLLHCNAEGDYYRHFADVATGNAESKAAEDARVVCAGDTQRAEKHLVVTHSARLGLVLNFSVFRYEVLQNPDKACEMVRVAFKDVIVEPDNVAEDSFKDSTLDTAGGVHFGKDDLNDGADDQGTVFRHARDETEDAAPLTYLMATRLGKKLSDVREADDLWWLRPHGKTQVTIEHVQGTDVSLDPRKIHTVVTRKSNYETVVRGVVQNIRVDSGSLKGLITTLTN